MLLDQRLGRGIALSHPRALVEQPRDGVQRLEIEFDQLGALALQPFEIGGIGRFRMGVAEELPLRCRRHADAELGRLGLERERRERARVGVGLVVTCCNGCDFCCEVDIAGKDRDGIEGAAGGHHAGA